MRALIALLLFGNILMAHHETILLHHPVMVPDAQVLKEIVEAGETKVQLHHSADTGSENLALIALRMNRLLAASVSLKRLRTILPELKFVTNKLDETDLAILDHSLHAAGLTLLSARTDQDCVCVLVSSLKRSGTLYKKVTQKLKKI